MIRGESESSEVQSDCSMPFFGGSLKDLAWQRSFRHPMPTAVRRVAGAFPAIRVPIEAVRRIVEFVLRWAASLRKGLDHSDADLPPGARMMPVPEGRGLVIRFWSRSFSPSCKAPDGLNRGSDWLIIEYNLEELMNGVRNFQTECGPVDAIIFAAS